MTRTVFQIFFVKSIFYSILISGANCSTRKTKNLWKKDSECYIWKKLRVEKPNYWFEPRRIWATFCWIFSSMTRWMLWNAKIIYSLVAFQILLSKVLNFFFRQIFVKIFIIIFLSNFFRGTRRPSHYVGQSQGRTHGRPTWRKNQRSNGFLNNFVNKQLCLFTLLWHSLSPISPSDDQI